MTRKNIVRIIDLPYLEVSFIGSPKNSRFIEHCKLGAGGSTDIDYRLRFIFVHQNTRQIAFPCSTMSSIVVHECGLILMRILLSLLGGLIILISLPMLGLAALGFFGIAADVGPGENRQIGIGFLTYGLPCLVVGVLLLVGGIAIRK
jgi:hypothetical protein